MRDRPDGATLLALARAAAAGGADAELVARAVAIAAREDAAGLAPVEACRAALAARYGQADIASLLRRFSDDIRAGAFDEPGPARDEARRLLWAMTAQKLSESNPEYLAAAVDHLSRQGGARPYSL